MVQKPQEPRNRGNPSGRFLSPSLAGTLQCPAGSRPLRGGVATALIEGPGRQAEGLALTRSKTRTSASRWGAARKLSALANTGILWLGDPGRRLQFQVCTNHHGD